MTSVTKLFKTLRDAPNKGVKRHITNEIVAMYCSIPALLNTLLEEVLFLSESSTWEDRLAGSRILEELFAVGTISDAFSSKEYVLDVDIDKVLEAPKFLAMHYTKNETVKPGKDFIDLDDHNVVLSLSDISIPGTKDGEGGLLRRRRQMQKAQKLEEKKEIEKTEDLYTNLLANMESYTWERRHGAALLLAGMLRGIQRRDASIVPTAFLNSKTYLEPMLRVLILDRFNDYEMDIAVSPVRETVGKGLKEMLPFITKKTVKDLLLLLSKMGTYEDWQIKYSGLLGLQYVQDIIHPEEHKEIVIEIGKICLNLLNDLDEDVKRIAASILTGLMDRYCAVYSSLTEEEVQEKIDEVLDVGEVAERCWEALEEEEDLAISKAKILGLLEKISHQLKYSLEEITKEKWASVLGLIRNPIDTVRPAVISMLQILPVLDADRFVASLLFGIIAEQEPEIREITAQFFTRKIAELKMPNLKAIVHAFLTVVCASHVVGTGSLAALKISIVIGEGDICATDDGCKSMGEEAVLSGRAALLRVLVEAGPPVTEHIITFFAEQGKSLPYFTFFKSIAAVLLAGNKLASSELQSVVKEKLVDSLLEDSTGREKNDLSRVAHSLARHVFREPSTEDADILAYIYNVPTANSLLRILAQAIKTHLNHFTEFFNIVVECVCAQEESRLMNMVIKEVNDSKKIKLADEVEENEPEWEILTLFKEINNEFLESKVFLELKNNLGRCGIFLQNTVECFDSIEQMQFIFEYAVENNMDRIVKYLITKSRENNEKFILILMKKLEKIVDDASTDHTEFLSFVASTVGSSDLSLLVVIVFPLVGAMNTHFRVDGIRELASKAFAIAAPSMWIRTPVQCLSSELEGEMHKAQKRVDSLMKQDDLSKATMNVSLREYQQKGVEWIGFLRKSGLSGMLCDDMGLGKTIQVLAFLALHVKNCAEKGVLVLCPSALTGHWHMEIESNFPTLSSAGIDEFTGSGVCVASFDKFRMNYTKFVQHSWFYLVLDEGHIIRNSNTLLHQRVKMIKAESKLLLSGTPIQNTVGELWALFDILMPGFLGREKDFSKEYIKPIEKAREGKGTLHDAEIAKIKLENLHKSVLPFILRRMKEAVLSDLPPKVISDIYVELEEVQRKVYDEISVEGESGGEYGKTTAKSGNFSLLCRLIKTCSHLSLLSGDEVPQIITGKEKNTAPSGKVLALLDLLKVMANTSKILIFCQYKVTIDRLIKEVGAAFPEVKWLRLDGTVKGDDRSSLAKKFNADPEISIMYLTTHAGGLGLNLTGADSVIFFEHDWNPMMDLQAMDRAHRIGQKKSVNVFRLISKNTIEESIMSLQRFKSYIASTVVNQQNVEIESMDTSNALERLTREKLPKEKTSREEEYHDFI
ncbi:TATA-binding protein-associated factor [Nematocida ausubeli]|nr:TATA-binding protein-associated factor [Nematocida ausubeli]